MWEIIWNSLFSEYVKPLIGLSVVSGIVSAIWKVGTDRKLANLNHELSTEIANLRSRLDREKESVVHVFKSQFDLEIKIFQEIWTKVFELKSATLSMDPTMDSHAIDESSDERRQRFIDRHIRFRKAYVECLTEVEKNQPFIPQEIYKELDDITTFSFREGHRFELIIEQFYNENVVRRQLVGKRDENHDGLNQACTRASKLILGRTNRIKIVGEL